MEEREKRQRTIGANSTNKTGRPNEKKNTERGRERHLPIERTERTQAKEEGRERIPDTEPRRKNKKQQTKA